MSSLLSIDDLQDSEVDELLYRADAIAAGSAPLAAPFACALLFLTSSLRTRIGFAAAAVRLGGQAIDVREPRWTEVMSGAEPLGDTLRTLSGFVEVIVTRTSGPLTLGEIARAGSVSVVNGGEGGGEHPTQALIDLAAMRRRGPIPDLHIGIIGDLSARSVRSLGKLLNREPPASLQLIGPEVADEFRPGPMLTSRTERTTTFDPGNLDVVYLAGLPTRVGPVSFDERQRCRYALTPERASAMAHDAIVLSPLPLIDEIDPSLIGDRRFQAFEQSDFGLHIRTAVLERALGRRPLI